MNRGVFLTTLAGGILAPPDLLGAEKETEEVICALLDEAVDAQFSYDFARLTRVLHPASLELFRDHLSARYDELLRTHTLEQISEVSGLPSHPKDLAVADADFFVAACNAAKERHPDIVGDEKYLPMRFLGMVFDNPRFAHVVLVYLGAVRTERTSFDFGAPTVMTVKFERERWQVYSCLLARRIIDNWLKDLAKPKEAGKSGKV